MYRETKDQKYLDVANHIANYLLSHPNMPKDKVAYWDFNAPGIPNALRDASAASVMASAFIELSQYNRGKLGKKYMKAAETILRTLCSPEYTATNGDNGGFILRHSVGNLPGKSEVDVPLTYADYYFVEAMLRYKNLNK
jgi:unsaturated chondroitin disaccharide hydrolase